LGIWRIGHARCSSSGITLIQKFHWVIYIMGGFLVLTGIKWPRKGRDIHPERNPVLRLIRRFVRVTEITRAGAFVRRSGRLLATPLFIVVLVVETTDVIFAVDSIPASLSR
jgi:tellurite resistance protein TerC